MDAMKQKSPYFELAMAISWGLLGLLFLFMGLRAVGTARIIYLLFGVIDLMVCARYFLTQRNKN